MGLLSKYRDYKEGRETKKIEKAARLVKNAKAIKDDRWAALVYLAKEASGDVDGIVAALLARFEYSLEHGINDSREKDLALEGVLRFGKDAEKAIRNWLTKTDRIAWPLKALKKVSSEAVFIDSLKSILNFEDVSMTAASVNKNYDVLCYLRDYQLGDFAGKLAHFLNDPDERVRFAACEVLLEQDDPKLAKVVEDFLLDQTMENRRLKQAVAETFERKKWQVSSVEKFAAANGVQTFRVNQDGTISH